MRRIPGLIVAFVLCGCAAGVPPESDPAEGGWHTQVMPYLWVPSVYGEGSDPDEPEDAEDVDGASVLDYLDGVFMISAETGPAEGPLRVGIDSAWVAFEDARTASTLGFDAAIGELRVLGRIPAAVVLDAYVGGRYVDTELRVSAGNVSPSTGADWWDPFVGLRIASPPGEELRGWVSADIGGFGLGSDLSFELQAEGAWAFHDNLALTLGWRLLDVDYDQEGFRLDVQLRGFYLGLEVSF
jgi:hypothetical protein